MTSKYIAFDVGGTNVKHAVIEETGFIIEKNQYKTSTTNLQMFLTEILKTINQYRDFYHISGIAISMAGPINTETGTLESDTAGNVIALRSRSIKKLLEEQVNLPVEVENDGNCVALAEKLNGHAKDSNNFICVTIGTGIGGGIVIDGKILHGQAFKGGEFGFMITSKGNKGKEIWHHNGATSHLVSDYKKLKGIHEEDQVEGRSIFKEAQYDREVELLVDDWIHHISCGIYNLAVTLNPEMILIGGGVSAQENLIERIEAKLDELEFWHDFKVPIIACLHKNDAGMIGAVKHFLNRHEMILG